LKPFFFLYALQIRACHQCRVLLAVQPEAEEMSLSVFIA